MKLNQQGFAYALNIIRPKWNVEIILQLTEGAKRFNEIWSAISGISAKSLTKSLKHLEECGIIYRKQYPEVRTDKCNTYDCVIYLPKGVKK